MIGVPQQPPKPIRTIEVSDLMGKLFELNNKERK
jgi:hypothetical protein